MTNGNSVISCLLAFFLIQSTQLNEILTSPTPTAARFVKSPKTTEVVSGSSAQLECEIEPNYGFTYHWTLNGVKINNSTRVHMKKNTDATLYILRVDREKDAGSFRCVAENATDPKLQFLSDEAQINVLWLGEARVQLLTPENVEINSNDDVTLQCSVEGSGNIHVKWFKNFQPVEQNERVVINRQLLEIKRANPEQNGMYHCEATNEADKKFSLNDYPLVVKDVMGKDVKEMIPTIEIPPRSQLVRRGNQVAFDCVYNNADLTEWYFQSAGMLENNTKISILLNGTLVIRYVQAEDEGIYTCVGRKQTTSDMQSYSVKLKLSFLEKLTKKSFEPAMRTSKVVIPSGAEFQLTCLKPYGLPSPTVWWRSPHNHTISDSGRIYVDGTQLVITEASVVNDTGNYTCVAENMAGSTEISIYIVVNDLPKITLNPKSVFLDVNETAIFHCEYSSTKGSFSVVRWRKNGKIVNDEKLNHGYRVYTDVMKGTLKISWVKSEDAGDYFCEVTTEGMPPVYSESAKLSIKEKLSFFPLPVNKKLELGLIGKLHCKTKGGESDDVQIKWIKLISKLGINKQMKFVPESDSGSNEEEDVELQTINGTYTINNVTYEDAGFYKCIAENGEDVIDALIKVDVVVAPQIQLTPENYTEVDEGVPFWITCTAKGSPTPTVQWDKDFKMELQKVDRIEHFENGTIYIREVHLEDEGIYGCTAGNSAGFYRKELKLHVKGFNFRDNGVDNYTIENEDAMITKAVIITTSVAASYMILVVGLMVWCRYRRHARKLTLNSSELKPINEDDKDKADSHADSTRMVETANEAFLAKKKKLTSNGDAHKSDSTDTGVSQASLASKKSKVSKTSNYDRLQISRDALRDIVQIGRGEFGDVMIAKLSYNKRSSVLETSTNLQTVMVKSLVETRDEIILDEFKRQIDLFDKKQHENVAKLIGLSREIEPSYLILEYTDWGDLKKFILATKKDSAPTQLTEKQLVLIALNVARGAEYIADHRTIHKDIAARNCLLTSNLVAKLSLASLSKDVYREEYYKNVNQIIPLRWMPHEAVFEDEYSTKSDVYSWACLVWELFAGCELPLKTLNDATVFAQLRDNSLEWSSTDDTPDELKELQKTCWSKSAADRPTFNVIVETLTKAYEKV